MQEKFKPDELKKLRHRINDTNKGRKKWGTKKDFSFFDYIYFALSERESFTVCQFHDACQSY